MRLKALATHVHFATMVIVLGMAFFNPPSMPPLTGFGLIGVTFGLAMLLPPRGLVPPEGMASEKNLRKHGRASMWQEKSEEKKEENDKNKGQTKKGKSKKDT